MAKGNTFFESKEDAAKARKWFVVDATDQIVGRLATQVARILRGKDNPRFTPHTDTGDFVVVINAERARFTGNKGEGKLYHHHTGFPGGVKTKSAGQLLSSNPEDVIYKAVQGMLPKNPLGRSVLSKLKVYKGAEHPHAAQKPAAI